MNDKPYLEENLKHELDNTDNLTKLGIEKEDILFDEAKKLSYKLRPYFASKDITEDPHTIFIYDDKADSRETIETRSKLIQILGEPIKIRRTYVRREKKEILMKYLHEKHPDLK